MSSRSKGAKAERNVAKLFEAWTGKEFARVPSSGGLRWKKRTDVIGDITCQDEDHYFPFSVEIKFYKFIDFSELIRDVNCTIREFWKQTIEQADRAKRIPLLLFRYNGLPRDFYFVMTYTRIHDDLKVYLPGRSIRCGTITIFRSDVLFKSDYKAIKKTLAKYRDEKK